MSVNAGAGIIAIFPLIAMLCLTGLGITCMILFIRVAVRAIKALDIYLAEKSQRNKLY
ncbi:hypothetical protein [Paenibacillus sp.]|uniref:hypothetical protein n=1 Tax=Paenibacillus sp. TaxID=58172 RepID=UPI00281BC494|nr:hypothetical protein [Paenibacillus sp.]MDR0267341.1 hypothetical protein [Paenibacillus sp.]